MKHILYLFLSCLLATGFFACTDDSNDELSPDTPSYVLEVEDEYSYTKINDFSSGNFKMEEYRVVYTTTDYNGEKVRVSMYLSVPDSPKRTIIDCHATIAADKQAPSYSRPAVMTEAVAPLLNAVCIAPDYIGYGESKSHIHAFADPLLHGRTVRDGVKVAYDMIANKLGKTLPKSMPSFIIGASQGGGVALATQRAIEEEEGLADYIQFNESYIACSALNFANITRVWTTEWKENAFPSGLVMSLLSMIGEEMVTEDIIPEILTTQYIETGIVEMTKKKEKTSNEIIEYTVASLYPIYKDAAYPIPNERIFSSAMMDENSDTFKKVVSCMSKGNAWLNWVPKHAVKIYHAKEDNIVPYSQSQELKSYFDSVKFSKYTFTDIPVIGDPEASTIHSNACVYGYTLAVQSILTKF